MTKKPVETVIPRWRYYLVMLALVSLPIVLVAKVAQLQIMPEAERGVDFLQTQGDARSIRLEPIPAYRGVLTANGSPFLSVIRPR